MLNSLLPAGQSLCPTPVDCFSRLVSGLGQEVPWERRLGGQYTLPPVVNATFVITGAPVICVEYRFVFRGRLCLSWSSLSHRMISVIDPDLQDITNVLLRAALSDEVRRVVPHQEPHLNSNHPNCWVIVPRNNRAVANPLLRLCSQGMSVVPVCPVTRQQKY